MQLKADPLFFNLIFFSQLIDNSLADVTERSDVVGKYFEGNHGLHSFLNIEL